MTSDSQGGSRESTALHTPPAPARRAARLGGFAPLLALLPFAAALVLADLGGPALWEDEGDTAIFARAILEAGVPRAWDGRHFSDSDAGLRVAPGVLGQPLVMVGTPWLPYYVTAASFALFGESEWAARLPFALAGIATLAVLYALVLRATGSARAAFAAAALLMASAQFLLYARESRSYALNMLLTLTVLWGFLRLDSHRRDPWLAVAAVLLFHVQILPAALALAACAAVALLVAPARPRLRPLLARVPWVAALTLPWLPLAWLALGANWEPPASAAEFLPRLAQLGLEASLAVPLLGWAIGLPWMWRRLGAGDRLLLALCGAWLAACVALVPLVLPAQLSLVLGLRYVCALLPISAAVTGVLVARASGGSNARMALWLALFAGTHLAGNALPWLWIGESRRVADVATASVPRELPDKLLNTSWWAFVRGLGVRDPGTLPPLVELLRREAGADDVVVANFGWDNLYWYTDLAQGMRIAPDAAVRETARALGLPAYVFGLDDADWVVWRGGASPLFGQTLPRVRAALEARGARVERVATLRETMWENRPELAFHRFPRVGHLFAPRRMGAQGAPYPPAQVFRIHWPAREPAAPSPP